MSIYSITPLGENPSENYHLLAADLQNACKIAYSSYSTDGLLSYGILKSPTEIAAGIANGTITAEPTLPIIGATSAVNVQLYQLNKAAYEAYKEAGNKIKDALIMSAGQHIFCLRDPVYGFSNVTIYDIYNYLDGLYGQMSDALARRLHLELENHKMVSTSFDAEVQFYNNIFFIYQCNKEPIMEIQKIDYKNVEFLKGFLTERGKILPARISGTANLYQRRIAQEIKRARIMALLPYNATSY